MKKIICIISLVISSFIINSINAENIITVNDKEIAKGQSLYIFKDELEGSKIIFSLKPDYDLDSAEISLDGGRSWNFLDKDGNTHNYKYRPSSNEELKIVFIFHSQENDLIKTYNPYIKVIYCKERPEDALFVVLDKMKRYYEDENKNRFLNLVSSVFPKRVEFEEAIQNDFYNYNNIRLRYRVDRKTFSEDLTSAIWDVYFDRKCDDRNGSSQSDSAIISMQFKKTASDWKITGLNNNTIFGSSLLVTTTNNTTTQADLEIAASDITKTANYDVTAAVHNSDDASATSIRVDFYDDHTGSFTLHGHETISTISANSQSSTTHDFSSIGPGPYNFRVIVDPADTISESDETNNTATKTLTLG